MNTERFDLVMFDLDGTLVDTSRDIAASMNHVLRGEGMEELPVERVVQFVGYGVRRLLQRGFEAVGRTLDGYEDRLYEVFVEHYRAHMLDTTRLYPGVAETLARLGGRRLAVVTNKPERPAHEILQGLGVHGRFAAVVGGDTLERRKPDPLPVTHLLEKFGVEPARALMVGDTGVDIATAKAAGARSCVVRYGYAYCDDLSAADWTIDRFADLLQVVDQR